MSIIEGGVIHQFMGHQDDQVSYGEQGSFLMNFLFNVIKADWANIGSGISRGL